MPGISANSAGSFIITGLSRLYVELPLVWLLVLQATDNIVKKNENKTIKNLFIE